MNLTHNVLNFPEPSKISLCQPFGKTICELNSIDVSSVDMSLNLNNLSEINFDIEKYIVDENGNKIIADGYNEISKFMEISVSSYGKFIVNEPKWSNDGNIEKKSITAESLEVELANKFLVGFKVNKGVTDSMEYLARNNKNDQGAAIAYVCLYRPSDSIVIDNSGLSHPEINPKELSLLDLVLEKCPGWSIGYIDPYYIKNNFEHGKFSYDIDNQDIYSFLTTVVSKDAECVFKFDTFNRTINVYWKENIGKDTNVVIGFRNLMNSINKDIVNESDIATRFYVQGGDDLNILDVNFASNYIENIDYFLNENYLEKETIKKYNAWKKYKESKRNEYIELSRQYKDTLKKVDDIKYDIMLDACDYTNWSGNKLDVLVQEYAYYETLLMTFRADIDKDNNECKYYYVASYDINNMTILADKYFNAIDTFDIATQKDCVNKMAQYATKYGVSEYYLLSQYQTNGIRNYQIYKDTYLVNRKTDHDHYLNILKPKKDGYYTYYQVLNYVLPNIKIAIENFNYVGDDKDDLFDREYEWNPDLYGTIELDNKIKTLKSNIQSLLPYKDKWTGSNEQIELAQYQETYEINHNLFSKYDQLVKVFEKALKQKTEELEIIETEKNELNNKRNIIRDNVVLNKISWGINEKGDNVKITFTDNELNQINSLYKDSTYSNDNIFTTTLTDEIDKEEELFKDATEKLVEYSQPQYHFDINIEQVFSIPEFNEWENDIELGNYIRVCPTDNSCVKLRIISLNLNPLDYSLTPTLTFSNMIKGVRDINDFTSLFDNATGGTSSGISIGSSQTKDIQLSTEILTLIANSSQMKAAINNSSQQNSGFSTDYLALQMANISELQSQKITSDTGFFKYLNTSLLSTDNLTAKVADINIANIQELGADKAFIKSLNSVTSNTITSVVNDAYIADALIASLEAGTITVGDLFAKNTGTEFLQIGKNEDGSIVLNGSTMQFKDDNGNVYIQLGTDEKGGHSLIIKDDNGTTLLDGSGITQDAIADELIVDDMVMKKTDTYKGISANALDINSVVGSINEDGSVSISSAKIYFNEDDMSLNTKMATINKSIENNILYTVTVVSSKGSTFKGTASTILTAIVKKSNIEVDADGELYGYEWTKYNADGSKDKSFSKFGKSIAVYDTDIQGDKAIYTCTVTGHISGTIDIQIDDLNSANAYTNTAISEKMKWADY